MTKEILLFRHRLSPKQVNDWLGVETMREDVMEKVQALEKVREFIRITDAFRIKDIDVTPLKGPALSYRLYGDAANRRSNDLDFLVGEENITDTITLFKELGYEAEYGHWPTDKIHQRQLMLHTHEIAFFHPQKQSLIELHWRFMKRPAVSSARLHELVKENRQQLEFAGRSFQVMSNELELLYLIIHGGTHWWRRLKWLVDIDVFVKTQSVDWSRFTVLANELKAGRMVALANAMLKEYFIETGSLPVSVGANSLKATGYADPLPIMEPADPFMVSFSNKMIRSEKELTDDFYTRILQSVWFALRAFPDMRHKLRTLQSYLFVPNYYGSNLILDSLPLFYLYGPAKLAFKRLKHIFTLNTCRPVCS